MPEDAQPRDAETLARFAARLADANRERHAHVESESRDVMLADQIRLRRANLRNRVMSLIPTTRLDVETLGNRQPAWSFSVSQLFEFVTDSALMRCSQCSYSLRGLPDHGNCPECGSPYRRGAVRIDTLVDLIARTLEIERSTVTPRAVLLELIETSARKAVDQRPP